MTDKEARRILIDIADQMPSDVCADWIDAISVGVKAIDAQMRDATKEERKSVKDYIESISKPTGVQFDAQVTNAKETIIKSALKYLIKKQIEEGSAGFAIDNDPDHDYCWDDVLTWLEAQQSEDYRNCKKWNKCPCGKEGHENGTSIGYSIGECKDYKPYEDCTVIKKLSKKYYVEDAYGYTDEDIVNKINEIIDAVNESSSTPQRPRGKWIKTEGSFRCSECLTFPEYIRTLNYCPECGSYNRGEENETSD